MILRKNILDDLEVSIPQAEYIKFHTDRYAFLVEEVAHIVDSLEQEEVLRILDIGPAYQTFLFRHHFMAQINTMGFDHRINVRRTGEVHFPVDLNHTEDYQGPIVQHDLIIFSEVIEHLYTQPEIVFYFLLQFLKPRGYLLLQTPNAVATFKRMMMLFGYNPFDLINEQRDGHFREYTSKELRSLFKRSGLEVIKVDYRNYFSYPAMYQKIYRQINQFFPPAYKDGITIIGRGNR